MTNSAVTEFLLTPLGGTAAVVAALLGGGGLLVWARQPGHAGRAAVMLSAGAMGLLVALLNLTLAAAGVWQAASYSLPLVVLGATYLLMPMLFFALVLVGYRWLAGRTRRPALLYGAILLVVVVPFVVVIDDWAIERRYLAFGAGYTIWMDALVGMVLFWLPVLLYEGLRRWQKPSSRPA